VYVLIKLAFGDFAALHRLLQGLAEEEFMRLLHVEPGMGSFNSRVRPTPVGENESFEAEVLLEHVAEYMTVLARKIAVYAIVGANDRAGDQRCRAQSRTRAGLFRAWPLADICVERISAALLVIHSEMFQIADDVFEPDPANEVARQRASEQRIFTLVFEGASAARLASQVHAAALRHVVSLIPQLTGD